MVTAEPELSVVIPARNEAANLPITVRSLSAVLGAADIRPEIIVVNDHSTDDSAVILAELQQECPELVVVNNTGEGGFGRAIRLGLDRFSAPAVAIFMADLSDDPADLVQFYQTWKTSETDAVFGTRWSRGGQVHDYPLPKKLLNRIFNRLVMILFRTGYDDTTNAFKLYSREAIEGCQPLLSPHFNLTVELPLKCHIRGFKSVVLPNSWTNRRHGISKLKIQEMGSRYMFILLYCWLEKLFVPRDYARKRNPHP